MHFKQIYTPGLAHCSYIFGDKEGAVVVDPRRDIEVYLQVADEWNLPIKGILETHLHADFISGHMDLAQATGALIYAPAAANCKFPHHAAEESEIIVVGTLAITMLETPGHTPEGAVFMVSDRERGEEPILVFSGDTLLVGDVGRPDLFPDLKYQLAAQLYRSLGKLRELENNMEVYPAHGMGSLCGRSLSAKLSSTIGTEKKFNSILSIHPEEVFVQQLLAEMPEAPDHFARCSEINRQGPVPVHQLNKPRAIEAGQFAQLVEQNYQVVDTRDQLSYAGAHIPRSYALSLKGNFATFSGWVLPPDKPLIIVADDDKGFNSALLQLRRVGLDQVEGYLKGGISAWITSGYQTDSIDSSSVFILRKALEKKAVTLIDTRLRSEWLEGHIPEAMHIPAPDIRHRHGEIPTDKPVAVICSTGNRSILAASLLRQKVFTRVVNVVGGVTAWKQAGFSLV